MYKIKKYSYDKAKEIGVIIEPSKKKNYKIDVFNLNKEYITSIGDKSYLDYPTYLRIYGPEVADKRRKLFHLRHKSYPKYSRGWYSKNILW
jgi:hypothetical protein